MQISPLLGSEVMAESDNLRSLPGLDCVGAMRAKWASGVPFIVASERGVDPLCDIHFIGPVSLVCIRLP